MTRAEAARLLAWVAANHPQMQERDLRPTAELWCRMLADIPYELAERAVAKILATNRFWPSVAEVREAALELSGTRIPTAAEAWGEVRAAIGAYGYYRPGEAMASLSPAVRQAVSHLGWSSVCQEDESIIRAHFLRTYEACARREQELAVVPPDVREMLQAAVRPAITGGER